MKPPKTEIPMPGDIHNASILGEEAVTELFIRVTDTVKTLHIHIGQLNEEIRRLRSQSARNSDSSGRPPSGDGLKKKSRTEVHRIGTYVNCQTFPENAPVIGVDRRQVSDIPPIRIGITGHRIESLRCPECGHHNKARFPAEVSRSVRYGFRVKSQAVYFSNCHHIPPELTYSVP